MKMARKVNRRRFLKKSLAASAGTALAFGFEEKALAAHVGEKAAPASAPANPQTMPMGTIKDVSISRLICGGNLISGIAHSRDLIYVSSLLKHYFTDEKVFETFKLCEAQGINTAIVRTDPNTQRIWQAYWGKEGGKLQWIAQVKPTLSDPLWDTRVALDLGATGVQIQGETGDAMVRQNRLDVIAKVIEYIQANGAIAGVGAHDIKVVAACEKAGIPNDFYMKTFNSKQYWSAGPKERHDSVFEETPEETIEIMRTVTKPWIAFKVLGAGAIQPEEGFSYALKNGADFLCVGMFDFQVATDAAIARKCLAEHQNRERPWRA